MADEPLFANVTVHYKMHSDRRFDLLAELGGWTRGEACWRMITLWARCTAMQTDRPPTEEIRIALGLRGEALLLEAVLGERQPDGSIRLSGGGLSGGDTDRFSWYQPVRSQQSEAGLKRARTAVRGPGGRFGAGSSDLQRAGSAGPAVTSALVETVSSTANRPLDRRSSSGPSSGASGAGPAGASGASGSPAVTSGRPASGFSIPEDQKRSLPRAILPSAEQAPTAVPPGESAWHRRMRWWEAMLRADARIRRAGIGQNDPTLPPAPAGANEHNMNTCERHLVEAGFSIAEVDAKMLHIVAVAEAEAMRERSRRYFKPALIWKPENANRAFDTSLEEAQRSRTNGKGGATSVPAPVKRPDRGPAAPMVDADERAAVAEMAKTAAAKGFTAKPPPEDS